MIRLELDWAVAVYCVLSVFLVIIFWIFYNYTKAPELKAESERLQQCNVCLYVFFNYQAAEIIACPLCKSLIQVQGGSTKKESA
jgi:hypothetical protein